MATNTKESQTNAKQQGATGALQAVQKDTRPLREFITKFNNDWSMNLSAALAYNLLMAIFPIALAILAILGLVLGSLSPTEYSTLQGQILTALPISMPPSTVQSLTKQLANASSILGIIAVDGRNLWDYLPRTPANGYKTEPHGFRHADTVYCTHTNHGLRVGTTSCSSFNSSR